MTTFYLYFSEHVQEHWKCPKYMALCDTDIYGITETLGLAERAWIDDGTGLVSIKDRLAGVVGQRLSSQEEIWVKLGSVSIR